MLHTIMGFERALPWLLTALACGYLIGSIPFGIVLARIFSLGDLRKIGSGNIGATNVLRTGNKLAAAFTLVLDMAKGLVAVLIFINWGDLAAQAAGIGAVLGHCLPVWLRFRGGKGVATFIGVILGLFWLAGLLVCGTWLLAAAVTRISSASALAAAASAPLWLYVTGRPEAILAAALLAVWVWLRHSANIGRLVRGEEPRIGSSGS
ncbi:MAG: glycerol-3-phosphate 1-O-acyltransferase PlsY [Pseudomonadota bacterium]